MLGGNIEMNSVGILVNLPGKKENLEVLMPTTMKNGTGASMQFFTSTDRPVMKALCR
jgi:hypothetical protein